MCLTCVVEAKLIKEDVIPGYNLYQSVKHDDEWPKDWYGLVQLNGPDFIWEWKMIPEPPGHSLSSCFSKEYFEWDHKAGELEREDFVSDIRTGYLLYKACLEAGYKEEDDGRIMWFLVNRIGKSIQEFEKETLCVYNV